jgi:hypothetical protein
MNGMSRTSGWRRGIFGPLAAGMVVGACAHAAAATNEGTTDLVVRVVQAAPSNLSELEAVIGRLERDRSNWADAVGPLRRETPSSVLRRVRVSLVIDPFHQDPRKVEDPLLAEYLLSFGEGVTAARLALRFHLGGGDVLRREGERAVERFGSFYLTADAAGEGFNLAWYREEPEFAIPLRSEDETRRLTEAIGAVADARWTREAIERQWGALRPNVDKGADQLIFELWSLEFHPIGAAKPKRLHISFRRPLDGAALIRRLGIEEPRVTAGDVHQQSRGVIDFAHRLSLETGYPLPARGGYALDIEVADQGLVKTDEDYPASPVWKTDRPQITWITALAPIEK